MTTCINSSSVTEPKCLTLAELLSYRAKHQSDQTGYTFLQKGETESSSIAYRELDLQARAIAAKLQSLDAAGSRALLLYPPGLEFVAAFFGCMYGSVVAVPAYPPRQNQNMSRLLAIVASSQATVALTTTPILTSIESCFTQDSPFAQMQWVTTDNLTDGIAETWQKPEIGSDTLAFLQYTSGSTGTPKGVMVSQGNLMHNSAAIHQCFGHTPNSHGVIWLPPYHDMGLIGGVLQPLYGGFPVTLMSSVDFLQKPWRWLQAISRHKATTSGGPNFAYDLCVRKIKPEYMLNLDLSSWEVAFTGAEPVRAHTLEQFADTFADCGFRKEAFYPCYGMAETTLIVSGGLKTEPPIVRSIDVAALEQNRIAIADDKGDSRAIVSVGKSVLDHKIAIVDPESLTPCLDNKVGEIWVSGASVAQGYWDRAEETKQTFHAYLDTDESPYLRTGDLGFLHNGELFITGRIKDVIIIRGQNHYPQDIELTVENSHPSLRKSCGAAFAVEVKGEERVVVVQEVERSYLRKLAVKEVVASIQSSVAAAHGLQIYATVLIKTGSIPKTSSGKIQRYACRAGFLNGSLNVMEDWSENPQSKAKFLHLQAEVESVLQRLSTGK